MGSGSRAGARVMLGPGQTRVTTFVTHSIHAHNPKVGGSNPPPATNLKLNSSNHIKSIAETESRMQSVPFGSHSTCSALRILLYRLARPQDTARH